MSGWINGLKSFIHSVTHSIHSFIAAHSCHSTAQHSAEAQPGQAPKQPNSTHTDALPSNYPLPVTLTLTSISLFFVAALSLPLPSTAFSTHTNLQCSAKKSCKKVQESGGCVVPIAKRPIRGFLPSLRHPHPHAHPPTGSASASASADTASVV